MQTSVFNLIRLAASYGFYCCLWYDSFCHIADFLFSGIALLAAGLTFEICF